MIDNILDQIKSMELIVEDSQSTESSPKKSNLNEAEVQELLNQTQQTHFVQDIRLRYMSKLKQNGLLFDRPRQKCHHSRYLSNLVTIFDRDDTLFPTSYLQRYNIMYKSDMNPSVLQKIYEIDSKISSILVIAAELSIVYIVTNAIQGWVYHCLRNFVPKTKKLVKQLNIVIISARSRYISEFPYEPTQWKIKTFKDILQPVNKNLVTLNLTCIGDSMTELNAAEQLEKMFSKQILKTVKFYEKPRIDELYKELNLLNQNIRKIIISTKNMQIKMNKK